MGCWKSLVPVLLLAGACSGESSTDQAPSEEASGPLVVATVNYPLAYMAERIGGTEVEVLFPAPQDVDPAHWNPTADDITRIQKADVILLNGAGYAAWTRTATLPTSRVVDTSATLRDRLIQLDDTVTHTHGPEGDHEHGTTAFTTWLDPELAARHALAVTAALTNARPAASDAFAARLDELAADLRALDAQLQAAVASDPGRAVIFSHPVYDYLARRYTMNAKSVHWEPDQEVNEEQWAELDRLVAEHGARWMIWEGPPLPETAAELERRGVRSVVLAPCGNRPPAGDLLTVLTEGAAALEQVYGTE